MTKKCELYLITPPSINNVAAFADVLAGALDAGPVAALQIRLKDCDDDMVCRAYEHLAPVAFARNVAVLINDRADLAHKLDADGVHLGQEDTPAVKARALLGPQKTIGVTAHNSRHLAMLAGEAGADYVAFGAFFESATKTPKMQATTDILSWWSELFEIPCVAIGGITAGNCAPLVRAGADFLAVCSGVWSDADGPAQAVRALNAAMDAA